MLTTNALIYKDYNNNCPNTTLRITLKLTVTVNVKSMTSSMNALTLTTSINALIRTTTMTAIIQH